MKTLNAVLLASALAFLVPSVCSAKPVDNAKSNGATITKEANSNSSATKTSSNDTVKEIHVAKAANSDAQKPGTTARPGDHRGPGPGGPRPGAHGPGPGPRPGHHPPPPPARSRTVYVDTAPSYYVETTTDSTRALALSGVIIGGIFIAGGLGMGIAAIATEPDEEDWYDSFTQDDRVALGVTGGVLLATGIIFAAIGGYHLHNYNGYAMSVTPAVSPEFSGAIFNMKF